MTTATKSSSAWTTGKSPKDQIFKLEPFIQRLLEEARTLEVPIFIGSFTAITSEDQERKLLGLKIHGISPELAEKFREVVEGLRWVK
jgi:hypothetical protein